MPTTQQLLKAFGHLGNVSLGDINSDSVAAMVSPELADYVSDRCCSHPDSVDQEIIDADPGQLASMLDLTEDTATGLIVAHERMSGAAFGRGFAKGCDPEYPDHYIVKYFIDEDTFPAHYLRPVTKSELEQMVEARVWLMDIEEVMDRFNGNKMLDVAAWMVDETYRRLGAIHKRVFDGPDGQEHNIHLKATVQPGPQIGIAWFTNGVCGDHVNNHLDSTYHPGLMGTAKLLGHEAGHNHAAEHQFKRQDEHHGVMSYDPPRLYYGYSTGEGLHRLPRDPSLEHFERAYGGIEVPWPWETDKPTPKPPVTGDRGTTVGSFSDGGNRYVVKRLGKGSGDDPVIFS